MSITRLTRKRPSHSGHTVLAPRGGLAELLAKCWIKPMAVTLETDSLAYAAQWLSAKGLIETEEGWKSRDGTARAKIEEWLGQLKVMIHKTE